MNLRKGYQNFFLKTTEGKEFMLSLGKMIDAKHSQAEKEPELARDHVQQAAGIREVQNHILSAVSELKGATKR